MSNQIPGVPEGWELVHVNRAVKPGEYFIDRPGNVLHWGEKYESAVVYPIIRKIAKPVAYRPFKDAEEYLPYWGKPIRTKGDAGFDSVVSTSQYTVYVNSGNGKARYTMAEAFEQLTFADGTPFGVKIDE
jgi:hypothetical protein